MRPDLSVVLLTLSTILASLPFINSASAQGGPSELVTPDASGILETLSTSGPAIDLKNPFFQSLGTNGRACITCHVPSQAWSITPPELRRRFEATSGTDPIVRTNDGSNSPTADVSTLEARRRAFSMLLTRGVIRVGIGIPANAEFELVTVDDPYGFANTSELSLFRRPLPSTNLGFLNTVMWDGRETLQKLLPSNSSEQNLAALQFDLSDQANGATRGHAQAARDLSDSERQAIVDFEMGLLTAQVLDIRAGLLTINGATGGPRQLLTQPFVVGINDLTVDSSVVPPDVEPPAPGMTLFTAWATQVHTPAQAAVARGQALFNSRIFTITGVNGLNDALGLSAFRGTCTTCHNTPDVGNHSVTAPLNIGVADASRRTPDRPLYTLRHKATGALVQTSDPGRALITGKWADIGKFKGPILRGLSGRAPYFHNGSAASLDDVLDFYNTRFGTGLTAQEHADLIAFLQDL
jgi:cytochrome c peroxidase